MRVFELWKNSWTPKPPRLLQASGETDTESGTKGMTSDLLH